MSDNNRYYWLKLKNDFFNQKEIKKLRKIAGGDTYTIIYLKMLLMSISDNGVIYYDGHEDNLVEQISLTIDEDFDNVKITMLFLEKHDLIETYGTDIKLPEAVSSIGTETRSAERVRKHREAKALQCNSAVTEEKQPVTICNTEIDIELEREINSNAQPPARECEKQLSKSELLKKEAGEIFDYYLQVFKDLGKNPRRTPDKINKICSRLKEFSAKELKQAIDLCRANSYLCGDNPKENFYASVEYVFRSFAQTERILERASTAPPLQLPNQDLTQLSKEEFIKLIKQYFPVYDIGEAIESLKESENEVSREAIFQWHIDNFGKVKNAGKQ